MRYNNLENLFSKRNMKMKNKIKYMTTLCALLGIIVVSSFVGCKPEENIKVETKTIPEVVVESEEEAEIVTETDNDVSLEDFDVSKLYCKERKTVSNYYYIDEEGVLWGIGVNDFGQLGIEPVNADLEPYTDPVKIAEDVLMVDASSNGYFAIYLTSNGELYGVGSNMSGLLGQPYTECYSENDYVKITEPVLLMEDVKYASAGRESITALKNDGSVWWWGEYRSTYLTYANTDLLQLFWKIDEDEKNPAKMLKNSPTKLLDDCVYAVTGDFRGAAIKANGDLYMWGLNLFGECGVEVDDDDYIRNPVKVYDGVKMVWIERVDERDKGIYDTSNYGNKYNFNVFIQTADNDYLAAGKDLGTKEKTIQLTGDLYESSTEKYSDEFVHVELKEYTEEGCRSVLNDLQWGNSKDKVDQILSEHHLNHWNCDTVEEVENSETEIIVKTIDVNTSNYLLEFDENDCLNKIVFQVGGSRNGLYTLGMNLETVKELTPCEIEPDEEENEYVDIYNTTETIDGTLYSFVFEENDGDLIRIEESSGER